MQARAEATSFSFLAVVTDSSGLPATSQDSMPHNLFAAFFILSILARLPIMIF